MSFSPTEIAELKQHLSEPRNIVITTHRSPDGDAIGSSLAVYHYMKALGHNARVVVPNQYPQFLKWVPGNDTVVVFEEQEAEATQLVHQAEIIFCLDYNALHRMEKLGRVVADTNCLRILIDHHQQPEKIAKYMLSDTSASSTCELVYTFMELLGDLKLLNKDIGTLLYLGIVTDTGSFRFSSTSVRTHKVAAHLIEAGVEGHEVHSLVFDTNRLERLRFLGNCLSEKLVVLPELETAYIAVSMEDKARFDYRKGDDEGVVNYGLSVDGVRFAALITEMEDLVKFSLRSKGDFNVNELARKHFNGGGHNNAAGGYLHTTLADAVEQFEALLPRYLGEPQTQQ